MIWPLRKLTKSSTDNSSGVEAMADIIAKLKEELESANNRANRYWKQIEEMKQKIADAHNVDLRDVYEVIGIPSCNRTIQYIVEQDDEYYRIIANHQKGFTISFTREFDTTKANHNWVNEGDALITLRFDNVSHINGCPTIIRSSVCGLFEFSQNKMIETGNEICRVKIYPKDAKESVIEELEREAIKSAVFARERKKMIERETLDELIAEGRVFNVVSAKGGVRIQIPNDIANAVWNRDGGRCCKCGSNEELEFDHIIPVSKGGATSFRNLQLLCHKCNLKKSDRI